MIGACCWRARTAYLASALVGAGFWAGHKAPQRSASGSPLPDCGTGSVSHWSGSPAAPPTLALSSRVDVKQAALDPRVDLSALCPSVLRDLCKRLGDHEVRDRLDGGR